MSLVANCFLHVKILSNETMYPLKHSLFTKGPCIRYVGGGPEGFCGVIKYFRHIMMTHGIFLDIIDGPQNIFSCTIFVILFFKLRRLEHQISTPAIKEI